MTSPSREASTFQPTANDFQLGVIDCASGHRPGVRQLVIARRLRGGEPIEAHSARSRRRLSRLV